MIGSDAAAALVAFAFRHRFPLGMSGLIGLKRVMCFVRLFVIFWGQGTLLLLGVE
jgi:hypothetical protein